MAKTKRHTRNYVKYDKKEKEPRSLSQTQEEHGFSWFLILLDEAPFS